MREISHPFAGRFGMLEMETAAERIMVLRDEDRLPNINNMETDDERIGLIELVYNGWLHHGSYNGEFIVTPQFLERIEGIAVSIKGA